MNCAAMSCFDNLLLSISFQGFKGEPGYPGPPGAVCILPSFNLETFDQQESHRLHQMIIC